MIKLNRESWHAKVFMQIQEAWDAFRGKDSVDRSYTNYGNTDICRYIRAWVIKLPLVVAIHALFVYYVAYVFAIYPLTYAGTAAYMNFWTFVGFIILAVAAFCLVAWFLSWLGSLWKEHKDEILPEKERSKKKGPSLWQMFKQWVKDRHDKICTTVIINGDDR